MEGINLSKLKNSVGKLLVFNISFIDMNRNCYDEIFSAYLKNVTESYIIVEQTSINVLEDNTLTFTNTERKLFHGKYKIDTHYKKLNH